MEKILEEIGQILEPLNNVIQSNSYNNPKELIDLKSRIKNELIIKQEEINDELDILKYDREDRLLDIEIANQQLKTLGIQPDESLNTDDIDEQINKLKDALNLIEDNLKLTEYTEEQNELSENLQETSIDNPEVTGEPIPQDDLSDISKTPINDNNEVNVVDENNSAQVEVPTIQENSPIEDVVQQEESSELVDSVLPSVEEVPFNIGPVISESSINDINGLNTTPFIEENNKTAEIESEPDEPQKDASNITKNPESEGLNETEVSESEKINKDKKQTGDDLIPIETLFKQSDELQNDEPNITKNPESEEDGLINIEKLFNQSNEQRKKESEKFEKLINESKSLDNNTGFVKNDSIDLNSLRDSDLKAVSNDLIDERTPIILNTQVTEQGIIANSMDQLCQHIYCDIIEELEKSDKIKYDIDKDFGNRYLDVGSQGHFSYYNIGEDDLVAGLPYGEYFNEEDAIKAIESYAEKNKGTTYIVTEQNEAYNISESKIKKIHKVLKTCSMLLLIKRGKMTESDVISVYGKRRLEKYSKRKDNHVEIEANVKTGSYIHWKDLTSMLERILKSKINQLEWTKYVVQSNEEKISEDEETIKHK